MTPPPPGPFNLELGEVLKLGWIAYHGCCWGTFCISACCGLVGNPHLTAKVEVFAPLPTSTKIYIQRFFGSEWSAGGTAEGHRLQGAVPVPQRGERRAGLRPKGFGLGGRPGGRPPVVPFYPFLEEGSPTKTDKTERRGGPSEETVVRTLRNLPHPPGSSLNWQHD